MRKMRYIPALDGVRALAVGAVVLYHLKFPWIQGGLLGVTMFFVISGFIITRLLMSELSQSRRIDFKRFYVRRARRLLPAILVLVPVVAILCALFNRVMLTKMRPDILPSLLFFNNWWQIVRNVSYFSALGDPSPLTHFWSLAIEEQFYLVWPLVLFCLYRAGASRRAIRRGVAVLAAASALAMAVLYSPTADPSRLYYGTDTRAFSLLAGVWLALIAPRQVDGAHGRWALLVDVAGLLGLAGLLAMFALTNGYTAFQYRGGMVLCTLLTVALIMGCVRRGGVLERVFSARPLVWMGTRSYGIYLWHYPLLLLMNPASSVGARPWWAIAGQLALVGAVAEVSYRAVEAPFRHGALGRFWHSLHGEEPAGAGSAAGPAARAGEGRGLFAVLEPLRSRVSEVALRALAPLRCRCSRVLAGGPLHVGGLTLQRRYLPVLASCCLLFALAAGCVALVPDASALSAEGAAALEQPGQGQEGLDQGSGQGGSAAQGASASGGEASAAATGTGFSKDAYDVLMIGDSVSVRTIPYFEKTFPYGHIDAKVSRQFGAGVELFKRYEDEGKAGGIAVFALGTNGVVTDGQIDELMGLVGDKRRVVFVTTRSPQPWVAPTNDALKRAADRYKNVRVVDWYAASEGRDDLFDGDGTHLNETGAGEYIKLVHDAVSDVLPVHVDDGTSDQVPTTAKQAAEGMASALARGIADGIGPGEDK